MSSDDKVHAGRGTAVIDQVADVARLTSLLWTPSTRVGRSGVTLGSVIEAAVALADAEGLEACTMRRLAEEVGVGTMTLYQYVPARDHLVALMLDHVAEETYDDGDLPRDRRSWADAVRHVADRHWRHLMRHPWIVDVPAARGTVGPGEARRFERELEPLDGIGLDDLAMDSLLASVLHLVHALGRWQIGLDRARDASDLSDEQWWEASWSVLARHVDEADYPTAFRVGATVASAGEPRRVLDFGLDAVLAAVTAQLDVA